MSADYIFEQVRELIAQRVETKAALESLDARLKVLEEDRRKLAEGLLKMREEDRRKQEGES